MKKNLEALQMGHLQESVCKAFKWKPIKSTVDLITSQENNKHLSIQRYCKISFK
jgi:hypothetical protein